MHILLALLVVKATVVTISADHGATHVELEGGFDKNITRTATCALIDAQDVVISTDCAVVRVGKTRTVIVTHATVNERTRVALTMR